MKAFPNALLLTVGYALGSTLWVFLSNQLLLRWLGPGEQYYAWQTYKGLIFVAISTLPLILAYALMAIAIIPRFRGGRSPSLLFFGGLSHRTPAEARDALLAVDGPAYLADLAGQCQVTAEIAHTKYRHVRNAYIAFLVALPFWTLAIFFLTRPAGAPP